MTYYEQNRERQLKLAAAYRERKRDEINRKQRERYARDMDYREYQRAYQHDYARLYVRTRFCLFPQSRIERQAHAERSEA